MKKILWLMKHNLYKLLIEDFIDKSYKNNKNIFSIYIYYYIYNKLLYKLNMIPASLF